MGTESFSIASHPIPSPSSSSTSAQLATSQEAPRHQVQTITPTLNASDVHQRKRRDEPGCRSAVASCSCQQVGFNLVPGTPSRISDQGNQPFQLNGREHNDE